MARWLVDEWIEAEARLFLTVQWLLEAEARLRMALQDWRDTVGGAATVCTIVQFLVGAQVTGNSSYLYRAVSDLPQFLDSLGLSHLTQAVPGLSPVSRWL